MQNWLLLHWLVMRWDRLTFSRVLVMEEISDLVIGRIVRKLRFLVIIIFILFRGLRGALRNELLLWHPGYVLLHLLQISS